MRRISVLIQLLVIIACTIDAYGKRDTPTGRLKGADYTSSVIVTDVPFDRTLTCNTRDSAIFLINIGTVPVIISDLLLLDRSNGFFRITPPKLPDTLDAGESLRVPATFRPRAAGTFDATIIFVITSLDGTKELGRDTSNLSGEGFTIEAHAHINRDYRAYPGTPVNIVVMLDDNLDSANITELYFDIWFNDSVMALNFATLETFETFEAMLKGTLLEGWTITVYNLNDSTFGVRLTAPAGTSLKGNGMLLDIEFLTHFVNGMHSELPFDIAFPNRPCATVITSPGDLAVDSLGIMGFFPVWPNPVLSSFKVKFLLGEPQTVTLKLFASDGSLVATPIDRQSHRPGIYTEDYSSEGLAPGAYTLVLHTEREEQIQRFVVLK